MPRPERPPLPIAPPNELRRDPSLRSLLPSINSGEGWRGASIASVAVVAVVAWAESGGWGGWWVPCIAAQLFGFLVGGLERRRP